MSSSRLCKYFELCLLICKFFKLLCFFCIIGELSFFGPLLINTLEWVLSADFTCSWDRLFNSLADGYGFVYCWSRYAFLFGFDGLDYEAWAHGLKKAGYATNPKYPEKLIQVIKSYGLAEIDKESLKEIFLKRLTGGLINSIQLEDLSPYIAQESVDKIEKEIVE